MRKEITTNIPTSDAAEFAALPEAVRAEVRAYLFELHMILNPGTLRRVDGRPTRVGDAMASAARVLGVSPKTMRRKYDEFRKSGDWRVLINRAKCPSCAGSELPEAFVDFWKSLCERNQRKSKPAYRELLRIWQRGEPIPGYAPSRPGKLSPAANGSGIPHGWSYRNLMRPKHQPTRFERTAARIGRSAAAPFRPLVFTTRRDLYVGAYYLFDDLWHDHKVHVPGQRAARRPLEFHALDLFSGCKFAWGIKPALENEEGTVERLKEAEMRFLLAAILARDGYSPRGTVLVVEHGTAAIREELARDLHDLSGGLIKVERSGMEGASSFAGQYAGRSKGNFRFKAALESIGNLIHNEMAFLPGQTGSNSRLNAPEELHGREREHDALCKAMLALPPDRAQLIALPFMDVFSFMQVAAEIYRRINERVDHELEGWEEAGLLANEFRVAEDMPWLPAAQLLALPPDRRAMVDGLLSSRQDLSRSRRLSPWEVWQRGNNELIKLPAHAIALILGRDLGIERRVRNGLFEFENREVGPGLFRFEARIGEERLTEGERYLTILNPHDQRVLHVMNAKGGYLGFCPRWEKISRADVEALHKQCSRAAAIEKELLYPVARRGAELTRQRIQDHRQNSKVLAGRALMPAEQERLADLRDALNDMSDEQTDAALGRSVEPTASPASDEIEADLVSKYFSTEPTTQTETESSNEEQEPFPG